LRGCGIRVYEVEMSILEVLMIICFGLAWPVNLYNSVKSRSTKGKNLLFMSFILLAYVFGILHKLLAAADGAVYFYIVNEAMVVADFAVYFVNRRREVREGVCGGYMQVYR
jgi:hypothetical protein